MAEKKNDSAMLGIALAGCACICACSITHPIEVVKVRMQAFGEGTGGKAKFGATGKLVLKEGGGKAFYRGLTAAWCRESTYSSLRLGLYPVLKKALGCKDPKTDPFWKKFLAAGGAGAIGSTVGNPFDVLKTRMQANQGERMSIFHHAKEVHTHQGGVLGFYRGLEANVSRAMCLNAIKLSCYDQIKHLIGGRFPKQNKYITQFEATVCAGFFMACGVTPFDMARTRLMNQPIEQKIYSGLVDCFSKVVKSEGPLALYKGFFPIWARFAPTATLQLMIWELLREMAGMSAI